MKKKKAKKIIHNYYKNLTLHINNIAVNFDMESIHQFRVAYKMLRAFLRIITKQYKMPGKLNISKKLKNSYHITGTIRDLQLQIKRITKASKKNSKKTLEYRHLLQKEIVDHKPKLLELFLTNPISKSIRKTSAIIPENFSNKQLNKFIQRKWSVVYNIIVAENLSDTDIHTIRKHLKDLFYNMDLLEGFKEAILGACIWQEKDEQYLKSLLDLLGKYQDKCTAIALLKTGWLNSLADLDHEFLAAQKKIWLNEKIQLKQTLLLQLKTDLFPINFRQIK